MIETIEPAEVWDDERKAFVIDHRTTPDQPYVDVTCPALDHVHRIPTGADIPSVMCEKRDVVYVHDRSAWSERARDGYNVLEAALQERYAGKFSLDAKTTIVQEVIALPRSMPASLWQHFKLVLRERWPRLFASLDVKWRNEWPRPDGGGS